MDRNPEVGRVHRGETVSQNGQDNPPAVRSEKLRHRGVRHLQYLIVDKLPDESESSAWWLAAAKFRAWEDGSVREDPRSLAQVAGISIRGERRCRSKPWIRDW